MINRWLKDITDIAGVEGTMLVAHNGQIIEKRFLISSLSRLSL